MKSLVTHTLRHDVENLTLSGNAAIDGHGNVLNNVINGNAAGNLLFGEAGHDILKDKDGNDRLFGGDGNDTLRAGSVRTLSSSTPRWMNRPMWIGLPISIPPTT